MLTLVKSVPLLPSGEFDEDDADAGDVWLLTSSVMPVVVLTDYMSYSCDRHLDHPVETRLLGGCSERLQLGLVGICSLARSQPMLVVVRLR